MYNELPNTEDLLRVKEVETLDDAIQNASKCGYTVLELLEKGPLLVIPLRKRPRLQIAPHRLTRTQIRQHPPNKTRKPSSRRAARTGEWRNYRGHSMDNAGDEAATTLLAGQGRVPRIGYPEPLEA